MKNLLKQTNLWLDTTIKNEFWYTHSEGIASDRNFKPSWHDNYQSLKDTMSPGWTREEYKEWVKTWKLVYSKLTSESQSSKRFRSSNRIILTVSPISVTLALGLAQQNFDNFMFLRATARDLLELRAEAKVLSNEAYLASHPARVLEVA
jgi:hypothetical protein